MENSHKEIMENLQKTIMENLQKAINSAQSRSPVDFKSSIQSELLSRLYSAINLKKEEQSKYSIQQETEPVIEDETSLETVETDKEIQLEIDSDEVEVTEANVIAPSAPATGAKAGIPGSERSNAGGAEVADPLADGLRDEIETAFGVKGDNSSKPTAKDDDISLDPNFEKEFFIKEMDVDGHKVTIKQIGLGLSKPVRVYVDGNRWEFFAGPEAAMKAVKPYITSLNQEEQTESFNNINEKVDIDGRSKIFKSTLARLESARKIRETKRSDVEEMASMPSMTLSMSNKKMINAINMKNGKYVMDESELDEDQEAYRKFFSAALKKFGASSPSDLSGEKKKALFNYIKKNWKG